MMPREDCPAQFVRYPSRSALTKLTTLFRLQTDPYMQDWEVELADASRVEEFLDAYDDGRLDDDDRFLLMGIIVASFDATLSADNEVGSSWSRIEPILRK